VLEITSKESFEKEIASGKVVVNFSGLAWCVPCQRFRPAWLRSASEVEEYKFLEVDVDSNPDLVLEYGIQSVPTVLTFNDGVQGDRINVPMPALKFIQTLRS
jgi:thioredoxin 1